MIRVGAGGTETVRFDAVAAPPGTAIAVGELTVTVPRPSPGPASDGEAGGTPGTAATAAGFGGIVAIVAAATTMLLEARRR